MQQHPDYTRERIRQLVDRLGGRIYSGHVAVEDLTVAGPVDRIAYAAAQNLQDFRPARIGDQFRPLWSTFWFRGRATVPAAWAGDRVDLLWDSQSEATLWLDGDVAQGLNMTQGDRPDAVLLRACDGGETIAFQIEMACNRKFGSPGEGLEQTLVSPFMLRRCELGRFDAACWALYWDVCVLSQLEADMAKDGAASERSWAGLLLAELNRFCNTLDIDDRGTWAAAHAILTPLYANRTCGRVFELSAIGHAHIDTAWLWPLAETFRKCARTFSTAVAYMRDYPEYRFACSQAFQYAAMREHYPELYARIREFVRGGQFVPVGGTWVEPDCNIPSGESLCRQFLFGQRFFEREFGRRCREFWNPDVFGYNGQLPQIMCQSGVTRFLTQKLSWNRFNKPRHHTFMWQGIDGSKVTTHFPPADTYNALCPGHGFSEVLQLRQNERNFHDHDRSHVGFMLFGYGDGGGGPTKPMLEVLRRTADLQGLPHTRQRTSDEFFEQLEQDVTHWPLVTGELYFELHRGTYTSQAAIKRNNRRTEELLHDIEFLMAATGRRDAQAETNRLWEVLLLNQFHDILPGSSITLVYEDSARQFAELTAKGTDTIKDLLPPGDVPVNTIAFPRAQVVECNGEPVYVAAPPLGAGRKADAPDAVRFEDSADGLVLENAHLRATLSRGGRLLSLVHKATGREALDGEANRFELYDDHPTNFDAWDIDPYHLETGTPCPPAASWSIARQDPLRAEVEFKHRVGKRSSMTVRVQLDAASPHLAFAATVDWQESKRMLKVACSVDVHASDATYEMQFGYAVRPTHYNTPYDLARFEVPMHRWFDLGEHGFGVAILNDCKYGGSTYGNTMRLSLLRAPESPDPRCDRGEHRFRWALMPHAGNWRDAGVVAEGYRFNVPVRFGRRDALASPLAVVDSPNLVLDTIKPAEDGDGVILRFYECHGARGTARVRLGRAFASACRCNVLEDDGESVDLADGTLSIPYRPHEIIGIKLQP